MRGLGLPAISIHPTLSVRLRLQGTACGHRLAESGSRRQEMLLGLHVTRLLPQHSPCDRECKRMSNPVGRRDPDPIGMGRHREGSRRIKSSCVWPRVLRNGWHEHDMFDFKPGLRITKPTMLASLFSFHQRLSNPVANMGMKSDEHYTPYEV